MDNLNMENFKTPLSWLLSCIFIGYLCMLIANYNNTETNVMGESWEITKEWEFKASNSQNWNFDFSIAKFFQAIKSSAKSERAWSRYTGRDVLNNTNFNFGEPSLSSISFLEINESTLPPPPPAPEVGIEEDSEPIEKKEDPIMQKKKPVVKKSKKIVKELPKPIIEKVDEIVKDHKEVIKEESIDVKEEVIIEEVQATQAKKEEPVELKQTIKKPNIKDYKNSYQYQKALREYYKEIEY